MTNFTVVPYQKENGDIPIKDFLNSLDVKMRAKMYGLIGILKKKGINLENFIVNILMTEYLNYVARSEAISLECYISSIIKDRLYLLMVL